MFEEPKATNMKEKT